MACPSDFTRDLTISFKNVSRKYVVDTTSDYNLLDQYNGIRYLLPDVNYVDFFDELDKLKQNSWICSHISEIQKDRLACLDIDFDIHQTASMREYLDDDYDDIACKILDYITTEFDTPPKFYIAILKRTALERCNGYYKDGIHFRIFVKFTPSERHLIATTFASPGYFDTELRNTSIVNDPIDVHASVYNAVLLYKNNKRTHHTHPNYSIHRIYELDRDTLNCTHIDESLFRNLTLELSLLFDGEVIKKECAMYIGNVPLLGLTPAPSRHHPPDATGMSTTPVLDLSDDLVYVRYLLFHVIDSKRYTDTALWTRLISVLACIPIDIDIAKEFSMQWDKYDARAEQELRKLYTAARVKPHVGHNHLGILQAYAHIDNPAKFAEAQTKRIDGKLYHMLVSNSGTVQKKDAAEYLVDKYGMHYMYLSASKTWYEYDTDVKRWIECITADGYPCKFYYAITDTLHEKVSVCRDLVCTTMKQMSRECTTLYRDTNDDEDGDKDSVNYAKLLSNIGKCMIEIRNNIRYISDVISHAKHIFSPKIPIVFDSTEYPHVIGVRNGLFDLSKMCFIESGEDYYVTRSTNSNILPEFLFDDISTVTNDFTLRLLSMIKEIIVEDDAREFIMIYLASSLNSVKKTPLMLILHGAGQNGKSTIDELMLKTFGSTLANGYGYKLPNAVFTSAKDHSCGPNSAIMGLHRARYATTSELEDNDLFRTGRMKEMSSDTLSCNEKYKTQVNFKPVANLVLLTNNMPTISSKDDGTWRRILSYKFKHQFVINPTAPHELLRDSHFQSVLLSRQEYCDAWMGILLWYYRRYTELYDSEILNVPHPTLVQETDLYRFEQDHLKHFITGNLIRDDTCDEILTVSKFYESYSMWYRVNTGRRLNSNSIMIHKELEVIQSLIGYIRVDNGIPYIVNHRLISSEEKLSLIRVMDNTTVDGAILDNIDL